jgi:hypothetical protein
MLSPPHNLTAFPFPQTSGIDILCNDLVSKLWLANTELGPELLLKGQRPRSSLKAGALEGDDALGGSAGADLEVTIVKATDLPRMDKETTREKIKRQRKAAKKDGVKPPTEADDKGVDAYVVIDCDDTDTMGVEQLQTKVVSSRNPSWKERHELSNFKWKEGLTLTFNVFDHDEGVHDTDDFIGKVSGSGYQCFLSSCCSLPCFYLVSDICFVLLVHGCLLSTRVGGSACASCGWLCCREGLPHTDR